MPSGPVVIEADLADRNNSVAAQQRLNLLRFLLKPVSLVWMDAQRGMDRRMLLRDRKRLLAARQTRSDGQHTLDTCLPGASQDLLQINGEDRGIQMSMGVWQQ
jgi:hypothetical protein